VSAATVIKSLDEVTRARLARTANNKDVSPADLLRMVIDDIERGEIDPDGLAVIWCKRPSEDEPWNCGTYRANLTRDQELVQLRLAERRLMRGWLGDDD
jgi:hypothetical protein